MTPTSANQPPSASSAGATVVRHFVAFQFKDTASPEQVAEVNTALVALKERIPGILAIERGTNNSPENLAHGFTDGFLITFGTTAERDIYLTHPAHDEFLKLALPRIEKAFVFDYETAAIGLR